METGRLFLSVGHAEEKKISFFSSASTNPENMRFLMVVNKGSQERPLWLLAVLKFILYSLVYNKNVKLFILNINFIRNNIIKK